MLIPCCIPPRTHGHIFPATREQPHLFIQPGEEFVITGSHCHGIGHIQQAVIEHGYALPHKHLIQKVLNWSLRMDYGIYLTGKQHEQQLFHACRLPQCKPPQRTRHRIGHTGRHNSHPVTEQAFQ